MEARNGHQKPLELAVRRHLTQVLGIELMTLEEQRALNPEPSLQHHLAYFLGKDLSLNR